MRHSVPEKHESLVPRVGTRMEHGSNSPAEPPQQQQQQQQAEHKQTQQQRLPALQTQPYDSHTQQRPATDPGQGSASVVHSAHFPQSAPAPLATGKRVDLRTPEWPPAQASTFQSMIGLSQVERRFEDDSRLPQSSDPRFQRSVRASRLPPRPPAVDLNYPAQLPVIPPSPDDAHELPDCASAAEVLHRTMGIISGMQAEELKELHSSLIRRRRVAPSSSSPSDLQSRVQSGLPSPSGGNVAPSSVSVLSASSSVSLHLPLLALATPPTNSPTRMQGLGGAWASAPSSSSGSLLSSHSSGVALSPDQLDGFFEEQETVGFYHE